MNDRTRKNRIVASFIGTVSPDPEVQKFLAYSVGRVLSKNEPEDYTPTEHPEHFDIARHIADWIAAAIANQEPWLSNVDPLGRPKKLLKFPTLVAITKEADKAMLRHAQKSRDVRLRDGDEELVMELADGYHLVRLLTPAALDRESSEMQHCIGNGGYDQKLTDYGVKYLSLRGRGGGAHATLEVDNGRVLQLQGKQNRQPKRENLELLAPFLRREALAIKERGDGARYMYVDDYRIADAWDLSDCTEVMGDLTRTTADLKLPEKLRVRGSVAISKSSFPNGFPREIIADGDVTITKCRQFILPERIVAGGRVTIQECFVEGDIDYFEAGEAVSFRHTAIEKLPTHFRFKGSLNLAKTGIETLEGLSLVEGSLDVSNTRIETLPKGIRIAGAFDANSSRLREYPSSAVIGGDVDISHTSVTNLPAVTVNGTLNISCTGITEIPEGLAVKSLSAHGLSLKSFASGVTIKHDLDLSYANARLPDGLAVGGVITLKSADVGALPANLKACRINGNDSGITSIGPGLTVMGDLHVCSTRLTTLPGDMDVWGNIFARQTHIEVLPDGFSCQGDLDLTQSSLTVLPDGLRVAGSLVLHANEISELPEGLHVGKDLVITHTDVTSIPGSADIGRAVRADVPALETGMQRYKDVRKLAGPTPAGPMF
ncbi:PcfJ domain-containing protein [Pararhizobium sp. BT-229]|uniref:PcfJ domain-containing protein n=1 Tax=Pararhizobium sp. BT-229 TaxID=2986923 RepID=UPI0021F7F9B2|nr:PcfJ domain-containing protein [Pararhizobium sp. BT-229]MCV9963666.1 PcfJ domain-containing protein [Pararhizobium sp. BT-229]